MKDVKKCPNCGSTDYEVWEELEYENISDPTPEYGGDLVVVEMHRCGNCGPQTQRKQ